MKAAVTLSTSPLTALINYMNKRNKYNVVEKIMGIKFGGYTESRRFVSFVAVHAHSQIERVKLTCSGQ